MKKIFSFILILALSTSLIGCSNDVIPDITTAMANIEANITLPTYTEVALDRISGFLLIDSTQVEQLSYIIASDGFSADEVIMLKMNSTADMSEVENAFNIRLNMQRELFTGYAPDELYKFDNANIYIVDNYALFSISSDNSTVLDYFLGK